MKKHKPLKIALICVASLLGLVIAFVGGFLIYAGATTLHVKSVEDLGVNGETNVRAKTGESFTVLTWNIGYGALDERQDCYWDGGTGVLGESADVVMENLFAIKDEIKTRDPDVLFLQEVDANSKRSYCIDEDGYFRQELPAGVYDSVGAANFAAGFVPLPLSNPTGRVEAGIMTFSKYHIDEATRVQLPIPFKWPVSLFNLKRCLLVSRLPITGSDKELVLINLHLEAYDDGEGKAKQLAMLMDAMKEEADKGNYVIAGGDFNQTFSTVDYQKYPKMNDWVCPVIAAEDYPAFTFRMDDTHPTCRSLYKPYSTADKTNFQYYMIDGFIVSGNVTINSLETIDLDFKNTDHNPVMMSVTLQP